MDLTKLFETQKELRKVIFNRFPHLKDQNNLDWLVLALQVELGELANEHKGFKMWSDDREPKTKDDNWYVAEQSIRKYEDSHHRYYTAEVYKKRDRNPLLEEYVDCLSFILEIGLEFDLQELKGMSPDNANNFKNINRGFNCVFDDVAILHSTVEAECDGYLGLDDLKEAYHLLVNDFIRLGEMLGLTWEKIEQAYYEKNKINHERQADDY